ncbi:MAG: hypothetical protein LBQ98_05070 [Nitrososphaerota archaeon]|nr:hypothetical protein [Nitrososphaerota archaeon]
MVQESLKLTKTEEYLRQLIGKWSAGVTMRTSAGKVVAGWGEMCAKETEWGINCGIDGSIEGYEDFYQNDHWTFDPVDDTVHLVRLSSEGQLHDHAGRYRGNSTLELYWRGAFEDQEQEEYIIVKWRNRDQFDIKEKSYSMDKLLLTTDYAFKRRIS